MATSYWQKTYPKSRAFEYKGQFKDDKPVGTFTYYYLTNTIKAVIEHQENSNRSVAKMYHENGKPMSVGIYRNLKKDIMKQIFSFYILLIATFIYAQQPEVSYKDLGFTKKIKKVPFQSLPVVVHPSNQKIKKIKRIKKTKKSKSHF